MLTDQDLRFPRGDTVAVTVSVTDGEPTQRYPFGTPIDLSDASARWQLFDRNDVLVLEKKTSTGEVSLVQVDGEPGELDGLFFTLEPGDTEVLPPGGVYYHEVELQDLIGDVTTILQGTVELQRDYIP